MKINEVKKIKIIHDLCGIYSITNLENGNTYIGSSVHIYARWKEHISMLEKGTHHQINLRREFLNTEDKNIYEFKILETFNDIKRRELNEIEDKYILKFREISKGYLQKTNKEIYEAKGFISTRQYKFSGKNSFGYMFYNTTSRRTSLTGKRCNAMINFFKRSKHKEYYSEMKLINNGEELKINNIPVTLGILEKVMEDVDINELVIIDNKIIVKYYKTSYSKEIKVEVIDNVFKAIDLDFDNRITIINSNGTYKTKVIKGCE